MAREPTIGLPVALSRAVYSEHLYTIFNYVTFIDSHHIICCVHFNFTAYNIHSMQGEQCDYRSDVPKGGVW